MMEAWKDWEGRALDVEFPLLQYLGGGKHSAVFLTERCNPEPQKAAVKLIQVDPSRAGLLLARLESAARLSHPGIIQLFHVGLWRNNGQCLLYAVMEYAPEDLGKVLPQRPLTVLEMREVLSSTLDALRYLHRAGFAHGHLKPSNIMAVDDHVKLSCDGLFRIGDPEFRREPGGYDPPEAGSGAVTTAGDIWSLAMTTVEALTQRLPLGGKDGRLVLPALPAPFLEIARHCLQEDPQSRWNAERITERLQERTSLPIGPAGAPLNRPPSQRPDAPLLATIGMGLATLLIGPRLLFHLGHRPSGLLAAVPSKSQPAPPRLSLYGVGAGEERKPSPFEPRQIVRRSTARIVRAKVANGTDALPSDQLPPMPGQSGQPVAMATGPKEASAMPTAPKGQARQSLILAAAEESPTTRDEVSRRGGRASYFSRKANGGHTASGEILNSEKLVAAHASYPLGTRVRVTNLANGKAIEVLIVDRLPSASKRIISISEAAARQLEFLRAGTAQVSLERVQRPE